MSNKNTTLQTPDIKVITPTVHGVLDYIIIAIFLVAPSVFGLTGVFAFGAYGLAAAQFLLTVTTDFAGGLFRVLSLRIHGLLELLVAIGMIVSPWIFYFANQPTERNFFLFFGIFIFIIWLLTDYGFWVEESEVNKVRDTSQQSDKNSEFTGDKNNYNE